MKKFILTVFLANSFLLADTVYLKNNQVLENVKTRVNKTQVIVQTDWDKSKTYLKSQLKYLKISLVKWKPKSKKGVKLDPEAQKKEEERILEEEKKRLVELVKEKEVEEKAASNHTLPKEEVLNFTLDESVEVTIKEEEPLPSIVEEKTVKEIPTKTSYHLNNSGNFYLIGGTASWEPAILKSHSIIRQSRSINRALGIPYDTSSLYGSAGSAGAIFARSVGFGVHTGEENGRNRGNFQLRGMDTDSQYYFTGVYNDQTNILVYSQMQYTERYIELTQVERIRRGMIQYDHDIYFIPNPGKYLAGLGIKVGGALQADEMKSRSLPFGSGVSNLNSSLISTSMFASAGVPASGLTNTSYSLSPFYPILNKQKEGTAYGIIGLTYRLEIIKNHELDLTANYYRGSIQGEDKDTHFRPHPLLSIQLENKTESSYKGSVSGSGLLAGYTLNFTELIGVRFGYESRVLYYKLNHVHMKTDYNIGLPGLGPFPTYTDRMIYYSMQVIMKF